ncbi:hypothetical protein AUP44_20825, partial [Tistrella mobilis]
MTVQTSTAPTAPTAPAADAIIAAWQGLNLIGGERLAATATLPVIAPATGAEIGVTAASGPAEVDAAVAAARAAWPGWAAMPA